MTLRALGLRALKLFPAEAVGGARLLASLHAPMPDLVFCPTGGIDAAKAPAYLGLPNVLCVGGSWMLPKSALEAGDYAEVERLAREAARRWRGINAAFWRSQRADVPETLRPPDRALGKPEARLMRSPPSLSRKARCFPIPPDVLLAPMALAQPRRAWTFALICTVASVLGGMLGYAIGALLFDTLGAVADPPLRLRRPHGRR